MVLIDGGQRQAITHSRGAQVKGIVSRIGENNQHPEGQGDKGEAEASISNSWRSITIRPDETKPGAVLAPSLMASGAFFGTVCILNSLKLEGSIPMRSNDFTLLSLHAPTLHDSILKSVLQTL